MSKSNSEQSWVRLLAQDRVVRAICFVSFVLWTVNLLVAAFVDKDINWVMGSAAFMLASGATYALGTWE